MNVLTIAGNLGSDAHMNQVSGQNGPISVCNFSVAVSKRQRDAQGNNLTLWVDCALWGVRAEALGQYLTKGSKVTVTGEADVSSYEGQNGFVPKLTLRVQDITLQGGGQQQGQQAGAGQYQQHQAPAQNQHQHQPARPPQQQAPAQQQAGHHPPIDFDDDIPF